MAQQARLAFGFGNVRLLKDYPLGKGAYGHVCLATLDELPCAAKLLHPILLPTEYDPGGVTTQQKFDQECRFLSDIRHPNIVQYLGLAFDPEHNQRVLLMELMDYSLTKFLEQSQEPLAYHVQVDISRDIALALSFLHLNRIVHRDLSSNNVLLIGPGCRAKVADFGMSKLINLNPYATKQTQCPGTLAYMAPEALLDPPVYSEKLDVFQAGVLMVQIITRKFPEPSDAMHRVHDARSPTGWIAIPAPQVERRQNHLRLIPREHPMLPIALNCLKDKDGERPSAQEICQSLSDLKRAPQYSQSHQGGLLQGHLQGRPGGGGLDGQVQEREQLIQQLKREKDMAIREKDEKIYSIRGELQHKQKEIQKLQCQLQYRPTDEHVAAQMQLRYQAERKKQEQIHQLQQQVQTLEHQLQQKEHALQQSNHALQQSNHALQQSNHALQQRDYTLQQRDHTMQEAQQGLQAEIHRLQNQVQNLGLQLQRKDQKIRELECLIPTYAVSQSSGPGQQSATVNHPTHVAIELCDSTDRPCLIKQNVTAVLRAQGNSPPINASVTVISPSKYEVSYTAVNRGQNTLHVKVNGKEVSTLVISVYPDPTQLGHPVRVIPGVGMPAGPKVPHGIAFNNHSQMVVSEFNGHQVMVYDVSGQKIGQFGSNVEMIRPRGIAIDNEDNIYVTSEHKLQKFSSSYGLVKCVGQRGNENGEFEVPSGIAIHSNEVYVCDRQNHRIQVFDLNLTFIRPVGKPGQNPGEFEYPCDVKFDNAGSMYVAEHDKRVQVMDKNGQHIRMITKGVGKPTALHIINNHLYVSDLVQHRIVVFQTSGDYVTSFGCQGQEEGEFTQPNGITSYEGLMYICDGDNHRIQVF